ncbi:MAG: glycosyltransferase family 2 protein [Chitinispirillaceae bacterium]|nr:glycosyltransferase family 2 protein [Chitinispirillaceae bacterium]
MTTGFMEHGDLEREENHMQPEPVISVILPVYNEEGNIGLLIGELISLFQTTVEYPYEIILVDDASIDRSIEVAQTAAARLNTSDRLHILTMQARAGQSAALMRGINAASGTLIITMDADLQHDPADIPKLLDKMNDADMVCGTRHYRSDGAARALCSKTANAFRNLMTGGVTPDAGCTFRVMRRSCVPPLRSLEGRLCGCEFFFHPLLLRKRGFTIDYCAITHRMRGSGTSRYRLLRGRFIKGLIACMKVRRMVGQKKATEAVPCRDYFLQRR